MPRSLRPLPLVLLVALVAAVPPGTALADAAPPARVLSHYETSSGNTVSRDCGYSHRLPSNSSLSIWLFCDTAIDDPGGNLIGLLLGSTAAEGPFTAGQVPQGLTEVPTPPAAVGTLPSNRAPQHFLPAPSGLVLPGSSTACGASGTSSAPVSWISGVAREPSGADPSRLLITYADVCLTGGSTITVEGYGVVEYDAAHNALSGTKRVFASTGGQQLADQLRLGSPVFSGGFLYEFAFVCTSSAFGACGAGAVFLARTSASRASWQDGTTYRWFSASGWTDFAHATSLITGAMPFGVHVDDYTALGKGLDLVEETDIAGRFRVWRASSPAGAWSQVASGQVPCAGGSGLDLCRALIGHPELSTSSSLLVSFFNPGDEHVSVTAVPW